MCLDFVYAVGISKRVNNPTYVKDYKLFIRVSTAKVLKRDSNI